MGVTDLILSLSCSACDYAELTTDPERIDAALREHEAEKGHRITAGVAAETDMAVTRNLVLDGLLDLLRLLNRPAPWTAGCTCGWVGKERKSEAEAAAEAQAHAPCALPRNPNTPPMWAMPERVDSADEGGA